MTTTETKICPKCGGGRLVYVRYHHGGLTYSFPSGRHQGDPNWKAKTCPVCRGKGKVKVTFLDHIVAWLGTWLWMVGPGE